MKAIAAMSENRVIGNKGQIPWRVSDDFRWFKEFTMGKTIVVGAKTFSFIPELPGRQIVGLTKQIICYPVFTMSKILLNDIKMAPNYPDVIIAGGAQIYSLFLPQITEFYITHIKGEYKGDAFMPPFEHLFSKQEIVRTFGEHKVIKYVK